MPVLTLKFKDSVIQDYQLQKEKSFTIGRRNNNDIVIENLAVSGNHAKIDSAGDGFVLTDLHSKNGCFVNEKLVTSHWLKHGDIIYIGKHALVFEYLQDEVRPAGPSGDMDKTMVMDTSKYRDMMSKSDSDTASPRIKQNEPGGFLSYLSGGDGEVQIAKNLLKIGKDPSCDIIASGLGVGRTAATISKRPTGLYLSFVGGISKIKVNSKVVKESVALKEFDIIELGSIKMQFFTKE
ncbi:MAG: FHA domain-containing protein, partial [Thermodesulfobacteriota bacterium]|nr:FHA domain-containing protein [Thermodesulfobacteriota bacterium]